MRRSTAPPSRLASQAPTIDTAMSRPMVLRTADAGRHLDDDGQLHEVRRRRRIRKAWEIAGRRRSGRGAAAGCPPAPHRGTETAATRRGGRPSSPSDVTPFTSALPSGNLETHRGMGPRTAWLERRDV